MKKALRANQLEQNEMNTSRQKEIQIDKSRAPLFASPWLALFFVLRSEFTQARSTAK